MKNLIAVSTKTMSSLEIAKLTGKNHSHVLRDIRVMVSGLYGDPDLDALDLQGVLLVGAENGTTKEILLDEDHSLTLVSGYEVKLRMAIVKRWKELETAQPKIPTTFAEALRLAADTQEKLEKLEQQRKEDEPKVAFAMAVRNMQGACAVGDFAKTIGLGRNRLFKLMRNDGILMQNNMPYQKYKENDCFVVIEQIPYTDNKGDTHPAFKTMITGKGQVMLANKYSSAA